MSADPTVRPSLAVSSQKSPRFSLRESILQLQVFYDQGRLCIFEEYTPKMMLSIEHYILSLNLSSNKGQVPNLHS